MQEAELLRLFDAHNQMVYRLAFSFLRQAQDAEDAVQAVFLKLIEHTVPPEVGKERAFLIQVTVNYCKDVLRSVWRRRVGPLEDCIPFDHPEDSEVFAAVMALPEKYRVAVHLHYYEGYSFSEIAGFLGVGPSAVSMRLHRARSLLKQSLGEDYNELKPTRL